MVTMIPDFARAMAESCRRAAVSLNEEICRVQELHERIGDLQDLKAGLTTLRRRAAREARAATRDTVAESEEVRDLWFAAAKSLREGLSPAEQIEVLKVFGELAGSGCELHKSVSRLWDLVKHIGGDAAGAEELASAGLLFDQVQSEAGKAMKCRTVLWQPSDPARLEQGRLEIREGKALTADEARARIRGKRQ